MYKSGYKVWLVVGTIIVIALGSAPIAIYAQYLVGIRQLQDQLLTTVSSQAQLIDDALALSHVTRAAITKTSGDLSVIARRVIADSKETGNQQSGSGLKEHFK